MNSLGSSPRAKRRVLGWPPPVVIVGLAIAVLLAVWVAVRERHEARTALASQGASVELALDNAIDDAIGRIDAATAFFRSSDTVEEPEFDRFVFDTGMTSGMFGMGVIRRVPADQLDLYNERLALAHPESQVFEVDGVDAAPVTERPVYYPIEFFASPEDLPAWGYDVASNPGFMEALDRAFASEDPVATGFISFPGRPGVDGFVVFKRAEASDGSIIGVVAAALDSSDMLDAVLAMGGHGEVHMGIVDVTDPGVADSTAGWSSVVPVADRRWRLEVESLSPDNAGWLGAGTLAGGVIITALLAIAVSAVAQRVRQQRELEELRRLDREKDDFLATVSHELRTPLTSIVGFAEALRDRVSFNPTERDEMVELIAEEASAMEGIVQDLLVATRLQQGGEVPVSVAVLPDIAHEVQRIGDQVAVIRSTPTRVIGNATALADVARLRQIIRNLLDNAARHGTPPVEVVISSDDEWARIVVRDQGPGVSDAMVPRLFDRYRSGPSPDGLPTSTGIGLWLSKELAMLMGGELRHIGGSSFEILLPVAPPEEPALAS